MSQAQAQAGARTLRWECVWFVQRTARRPVQLSGSSQERAGEDRVKEVRRQTVQGHCDDLGFSEMDSALGGLGAEG